MFSVCCIYLCKTWHQSLSYTVYQIIILYLYWFGNEIIGHYPVYIMTSFVLMSLDKLCYHGGYVNKIHVLKCRSLSKSENSKTLYRYYFPHSYLSLPNGAYTHITEIYGYVLPHSHLNLGCLLFILPMDYLHQCTSLTGSGLTMEVNLVAQWY